MGFFGRLFGSAKAGEAIVNNVSHAVDKIWYTKEEQAEEIARARSEGFKVYMTWLESTSSSRVARRMIALMVTGIWTIEHLSSVLLGTISVFVEAGDEFAQASDMLASHATENNALVGVVLLFYFGGPAAIDGVKGLVNRWAGNSRNDGNSNKNPMS